MIINTFYTPVSQQSAKLNQYCEYDNKNQRGPKLGVQALSADTVSFGATSNLFKLREVGDPFRFYDSEAVKNIVYSKIPILKSKSFGLDEYSKLSKNDKVFLRNIITDGYECSKDFEEFSSISSGHIVSKRTLDGDAKFFIDFSNKMRSVWDREHPDGYNLIFLGASPSVFERIMTYQGHTSVKNIPFTRTGANANVDYKTFYKKYGLTKELEAKMSKPTIIFDYFLSLVQDESQTLGKFNRSLNLAGINTEPDLSRAMNFHLTRNLIVDSIHRMIMCNKEFTRSDRKLLDDYFLLKENIKSYATCPKMESGECFENAHKIQDDYEWSLASKLMNFAIIDKIKTA